MKVRELRLYSYLALVLFVMLSFVIIASDVRYRAVAMEQAASDIAENAAPSIIHLSNARGEVRHLSVLISHYLDQADGGVFASTEELHATCAHIRDLGEKYQGLPMFPGEEALWVRGKSALLHLDEIAERLIQQLELRNLATAHKLAQGPLREAIGQSVDAIMASVEFDAREATELAQHIRELRASLARSSLILSSLGALWTLVTVLVIGVNVQRWAQHRHAQHLKAVERAEALESFAGQVAHDILNPLSTVTYALGLLPQSADEEQRNALVARGGAAAKRMQRILEGLLKFASAGAHPEPGARTEVATILTDLQTELGEQAAAAGIELVVEATAAGTVGCSPGILSSLLTNLVHNAIKYMGDAVQRRITLRVLDHGSRLRFEVEDTGPGLVPGLEKHIFEPYVRGRNTTQPGFGLGLATVKKAAEAHGGTVGVVSRVGRGCLFWFELPKPLPADAGVRA